MMEESQYLLSEYPEDEENDGQDFDAADPCYDVCPVCKGTCLDFEGLGECSHCDGMGHEWWK